MNRVAADISRELGPVRDQGRRGTCLVFATCAAHEQARLRRRGEPRPELGEELLYWRCKQLDGDREEGTTATSASGALREPGQSAAELWPYDDERDASAPEYAPPEAALEESAMRRASLAATPVSSANIESVLASGQVVVLAIRLWNQFFTDHKGKLQVPSSDELIAGGHAIVVVGLNEEDGQLLIRNSWGESWGANGHAWLPAEALETISLGSWIVEDDIDE